MSLEHGDGVKKSELNDLEKKSVSESKGSEETNIDAKNATDIKGEESENKEATSEDMCVSDMKDTNEPLQEVKKEEDGINNNKEENLQNVKKAEENLQNVKKAEENLQNVKKEEETHANNEESSDKSKDTSEYWDSCDVNKNTDSENEEDLTYVWKEVSRSDKENNNCDDDDAEKTMKPENIHSEIQMLQNKIDAIRARQATLKEETQFLVQQFDELLEHYRQMGGEVLDLSDVSM